ncbi:MAG TPA: ABC transporter permease [Rhodothermales bacterium]|nr:ABC transporter permease [Rhodothermales bacterium]
MSDPTHTPTIKPETRMESTRRAFRNGVEYAGMAAVLLLLVLLFGLLSDRFLSMLTFRLMANQIPALVVISVGMTYVLVIAGIDLSVGSVAAVSGGMLGVALIGWHWPLWLAVVLGLGAGLAAGLINGGITVRWSIPSFIVTLGMLEAARGLAYLITDSQSVYIGGGVDAIGAPIRGIGLSPAFFAALLSVIVAQVVLSRTVFGRYMVAIGTNEEAVRLSGIDPRPIQLAVFAIAGLTAGIGGVFQVAYLGSADPNAGIGMELSAIAAVVIGGTSLMGGRGSVVNSFFGVLIIVVLQAGLAQIGATEPVKRLITGSVIVIAVIIDAYRRRWSLRSTESTTG